jgi:hypothetical protein
MNFVVKAGMYAGFVGGEIFLLVSFFVPKNAYNYG